MLQEYSEAELLLDVRNPRFDPRGSQRDAINALFTVKDNDREKMIALATDIVTTGTLNPTELPIVIEDEDGSDAMVVIEGNRRVACLKVLRNPSLVDDDAARKAFEKIAKTGTGPESFTCYVAADRDDARHWLAIRHTGENKGVGVNPWDTEQRNRFDNKPGQSSKALIFTDAVAEAFAGDEEVLDALTKAKARGLTNVGRLIGDPRVRRAFGFDLRGDNVTFHHDFDAMRVSLLRLLNDLAANSVRMFMHQADRETYLDDDTLKGELPHKASKLEKPLSPEDWRATHAPESTSTPEESGSPEVPAGGATRGKVTRPERYIYQKVKTPHLSQRVKALLREAHKINIDGYAETSAVLLRVILELAVTEVGTKHRWFREGADLGDKVTKAIKRLDPNCEAGRDRRDEALHDAFTKANRGGGGVGILGLHQYVHGPNVASPADVRAYSAAFAPLIDALDEYVRQNP